MELVQLKYFAKIVEHQSFTKAASECSVSQPALSQQIAKLERELGQPLFERRGRSIRITAAGALLRPHAEKILQVVDDAKRQIMDDGRTGRITLSATPTIGPYLLPGLLKSVVAQFAQADFVVGENHAEELFRRCALGELNVGILALPANGNGLSVEPLFEEPLLLAVPVNHQFSRARAIQIDDLKKQPFILLDADSGLAKQIELFCEQHRFRLTVTTRINQLVTAQNLVALGHGISFVPKMACQDDLNGRLVYRVLDGPSPRRMIAMCSNPDRYQSQLMINVLKSVRELLSTQDFNAAHPVVPRHSNANGNSRIH